MRWLRSAAFGALVPLALFGVLANSVARRETTLGFFFPGVPLVLTANRAPKISLPMDGLICCCISPDPHGSIPDIDFAATQFAPPGLPFDSQAFVPAAERAFLPGIDSPARCQVVPGSAPPAWPERAERLGIRGGWVLVEFDLSELGVVENARVIDAAPHAVFEASALRTVERECRRPEIRDGRAVARSGVRVKLRFESAGDRT